MKNIVFLLFISASFCFGQNVSQKIDKEVQYFLDSKEAYSSNFSFYVEDEDGKVIYDYQSKKGLTTASTQKIFTAAAALETLGENYKYKTKVSYSGKVENSVMNGDIYVTSNGDPTLGSWRFKGYKPEDFKNKLIQSLQKINIKSINGNLILDDLYFDFQSIPGGWSWNDLGNYYGAGVWGINWRENQFDINFSGNKIQGFNIPMGNMKWINEVEVSGDSDQSIIFTAPFSSVGYINGKLPARALTVSGAMPNPPLQLGNEMKMWLEEAGIKFNGRVITNAQMKIEGNKVFNSQGNHLLFIHESPELNQIVYWFLRKSVNLYGETLIKTLAKEKQGIGSFNIGVRYLKQFWEEKGVHPSTINFADGSGLSTQNYVSTSAEVMALRWSSKQKWFSQFYESLPNINGMKMKSGTMKATKSFAGYHTSKEGKKYTFSIIVNNYQGANVSEALFRILNVLK